MSTAIKQVDKFIWIVLVSMSLLTRCSSDGPAGWEYKIEPSLWGNLGGYDEKAREKEVEALNVLGSQGWEIVGIVPAGYHGTTSSQLTNSFYFFKRKTNKK